jgi:hypothetical protein
MNTIVTVSSRYHRTIRKMPRSIDTSSPLIDKHCSVLTGLIGMYLGDSSKDNIAFYEKEVVFFDYAADQVCKLAYADIIGIEFPDPSSASVDLQMHVQNHDIGQKTKVIKTLRVVGVYGKFRDVFEIGRFFMRVTEDIVSATL